eukprot:SAG31_NODE_2446_length_5678_cov_9.411185_6_plen_101_part_00
MHVGVIAVIVLLFTWFGKSSLPNHEKIVSTTVPGSNLACFLQGMGGFAHVAFVIAGLAEALGPGSDSGGVSKARRVCGVLRSCLLGFVFFGFIALSFMGS